MSKSKARGRRERLHRALPGRFVISDPMVGWALGCAQCLGARGGAGVSWGQGKGWDLS